MWNKHSKKISKKSHTAENCRTVPKTNSQHPTLLNTSLKTYPTLIHRGEDPSRLSGPKAYLNT